MGIVFLVDWTVFIVGKLSPWINLDSDLPHVRANSEKVNIILYVKFFESQSPKFLSQ